MDYLSQRIVVLILGLPILWWLRKYRDGIRDNPNRLPKPPGPKGYPIIGSLLEFPRSKTWLQYDKWIKEYGDLVYFEILGQPFLLLGSPKRANDLLEKRSTNYSDRPRMIMALDMVGWTFNFAIFPYGQKWRRQRRAFHQFFNSNAVSRYLDVQVDETRAFLRRLLVSPDDFLFHCHHLFASLIMRITYGFTIRDENDPYIGNAEQSLKAGADAMTPGRYLVDMFPIMRYIPEWFPGAGWKRKAKRYRDVNVAVKTKPFEHVKEQLKTGEAVPSIATTLIESLPEETAPNRKEQEDLARDTTAIAYIGGAETTIGTVQSFFLAMAMYPEVQRKAQQELDAVLKGRLPEFEDRPSLRYLEAVVREAKRWHLVTPMSVPHKATNSDEYEGYHIPRGTIVLGCSWTILHDPDFYDDPLRFMPERFLTKDGEINTDIRDPDVATFGFGRRICPGRHLSDNSLFITIASVLAAFNIEPPVDEKGSVIPPHYDCTGDLISFPTPFQARITPRSNEMAKLVKNSVLSV